MWMDCSSTGASCLMDEFEYPWFFECQGKRRMMAPYSDDNLQLKSVNGAIFQFRLDKFHDREAILLTSTLEDTFWFFYPTPSIENTLEVAQRGQVGYSSKTSFSGIVKWGTYLTEQHKILMEHLKQEEITLPPEFLGEVGRELLRRKNVI